MNFQVSFMMKNQIQRAGLKCSFIGTSNWAFLVGQSLKDAFPFFCIQMRCVLQGLKQLQGNFLEILLLCLNKQAINFQANLSHFLKQLYSIITISQNIRILTINDINYPNQRLKMSEQNKISFTVNNINIPSKKNHVVDGMVALKKIQHFSYALSDQIGLGYSSHVYKGKNDKTNQIVAIKVIDLKKQDQLHQQFINDQVSILQKIKLNSPQNLLRLQGVFKTKNNLYIITEFCQGKDMAKILRKKKTFSESQARGIMKQFIKGYAELYRLRVVHRDLKLANIFVKRGVIKLADFGFAIDEQKCGQKFDYNVGSPFYMPPQSLKFNRYSYKSDVWAIGVIAFELAYGKRPWKDKDDNVLFQMITTTPIEELFEQNIPISSNYKKFISQCLRIDFQKRATPEFVINFQWDQAVDYVNGLQDQGYQPISIAHIPKVHHPFSTKNAQIRPLSNNKNEPRQKQNHSQIKQGPKKMVSLFNFPNKQRQSPAKVHQNSGYLKHAHKISQLQRVHQYPLNLPQISPQQTILSQVHYCRFISLVLEQIAASNSVDMLGISQELGIRLFQITATLNQIQRNPAGQNKVSGLNGYIYQKQERWNRLKQMIIEYQAKFNSKYSHYKSLKSLGFVSNVSNQIILQKTKLPQSQRILQLLAYVYQLQQLLKGSLQQFARKSKIQNLAQNRNLTQNSANTQRLRKKLTHLGF